MAKQNEPLSKEREKTIEVLIGFLKKARIRWALLLFICFVGLLANFASTSQPQNPSDALNVVRAYERLRDIDLAATTHSSNFQTWLPRDAVARIHDTQHALSEAKDRLAERGLENRSLELFTLGAEFDALANAISEFADSPPPNDLLSWSGSQIDNLLRIYTGLERSVAAETSTERQIHLGDTTVVERIPSYSSNLRDIEAFAEEISTGAETAAEANAINNAVSTIEGSLVELSKPYPGWPKDVGEDLANISETLEEWHVSKLSSVVESAKAQIAAGELKAGSISAVGLSIPGIVIKLLLPLLAFGIAIDIVLTLSKALRWSGNAMAQRDAAFHVGLFPWIPVLIFGGRTQTGAVTKLLSWIALAIHLSPPVLLAVLIYGGTGFPVVTMIAVCAIIAVLICQIATLRLASQLSQQPSGEAHYKLGLNDPTADLIKIHLERIDVAWTSLVTVSAAASIFFVAFLFVPAELLGDRSQLSKSGGTRSALEVVYEQRFKEHRDTYEAWSKTVDDAFHQLTFMHVHFPESHPGYELIETLSQKPPLYTYPSAKSNFDDIVTEDRASLNQLDLYDVNDLIELLYRQDLDDIQGPLDEIRESIRATPLPEEAVADLPDFLKMRRVDATTDPHLKPLYGKASGTGDSFSSPMPPLPITYRQWVEKGGFAYRLTPLPERGEVDEFYAYMDDKGFTRIAGFDRYAAAYADFDQQLGTLKLSLFGVEVDRRIAATVASWLILLLIALLLLRLIIARRTVDAIEDQESCATILFGTGVTFLNASGTSTPLQAYYASTLLLAFPLLVLGLIRWSAAPSAGLLDWSLIPLVASILLAVLSAGQRMALLSILPMITKNSDRDHV
ncbi:hypothetical protein [Primorskyibacter sedentarius]|nr:hypothetical protein [Primorskyibacter sedentarius]